MSSRGIVLPFACWLITITAFGCATVPLDPNAPVIKNLTFSDVSASGTRVNFEFQSTNSDIERVFTEVTVDGRRPSDADWEFHAVQWNITPGIQAGRASIWRPVRHSATRCLTVWVRDAKGNRSNQLNGCMTN